MLGMSPRQTFPAFRTASWKDVTGSAYYKWVLFTRRPFQYIKATLAEAPRYGRCCGPVQMPVCKHPREPRPHQQFCVTFLCNCSTRALISLTEGACNSVETRQISGLHHAVVAVAIDDRRKQNLLQLLASAEWHVDMVSCGRPGVPVFWWCFHGQRLHLTRRAKHRKCW